MTNNVCFGQKIKTKIKRKSKHNNPCQSWEANPETLQRILMR